MPLHDYFCINNHRILDRFTHALGVETMICACGESMTHVGFGMGATWFRENAGRLIHNLGPEPVMIRSAEQHKAEMKKAGVEWSSGRTVKGTGGWV
jgi:hypothetical protein